MAEGTLNLAAVPVASIAEPPPLPAKVVTSHVDITIFRILLLSASAT